MKKKLNMKYPQITSWTWQANLLSILGTMPNTESWIYSNYIQIACTKNADSVLFIDFIPDEPHIYFDCPFVDIQKLTRAQINSHYKNIKDFFIDSINNDYYIYGIFNEGQFLQPPYNGTFFHELFIFGYDMESATFDVADFTFTRKYSYQKVNMDDVCKSYDDVHINDDYLFRNRGGIILLKKYPYNYDIDINLIKASLYNYLYPQYYFDYRRIRICQDMERVIGVDVYKLIFEYMQKLKDGNTSFIDTRLFHNLYDHKVLMVERCKYLIRKKHFNNQNNELSILEDIKIQANIIVNIFLKMEIKNIIDNSKIDKCIEMLNNIKKRECFVYKNMLNNII